jgi:hypothetical protein
MADFVTSLCSCVVPSRLICQPDNVSFPSALPLSASLQADQEVLAEMLRHAASGAATVGDLQVFFVALTDHVAAAEAKVALAVTVGNSSGSRYALHTPRVHTFDLRNQQLF